MIKCKHCEIEIVKTKHKKIFCSKTCAATYNNLRKMPRNEESKRKTSLKMKNNIELGIIPKPSPPRKPLTRHTYTKLYGRYSCHSCNKEFWQTKPNQKCCSVECRDSIRSQNKCIKIKIEYYNHYEDKIIILQSSWELKIATWLTENNIKWIRPSSRLKWFDTTLNKNRTYLPDFFLPNFTYFIDVKNPIKQKEDFDKLNQLKLLIPLYVGNIEEVKMFVEQLIGLEPTCIQLAFS